MVCHWWSRFYFLILIVHAVIQGSYSAPVSQVNDLYTKLIKVYNRNMLPLTDQNDTAEVGVYVYMISMNKFDELSGELDVSLAFIITWTEERISWNQSEFGYQTFIYMAPEDIWRPKLFVQESYDTLIEVGNISGMVKVGFDGSVQWTVGSVIKVTCSVDVTFFPFDSQTCIITLTALPYTFKELWLYGMNFSVDTSLMKNNSQWSFVEGTLGNQSNPKDLSYLSIRLKFRRRSEFYIVYIIIPLVFLGGINNLVFFMPANTGERSSMAVTTFLSFVVFMQIVNSSVPQSSMPIAYIFYYLMFLLLYSSDIILFCIISIYLYSKNGRVSLFWKCFVIVLRCRCFRRRRRQSNKVIGEQDTSDKQHDCGNLEDKQDIVATSGHVSADTITWTDVGKTFDACISALNFLVYWTFSAAVFMSLYTNSGIVQPFELENV